jgi:hypothetical protein
MTISTQRLRFLRGNTAAASAFTGLGGELIVDTDLKTIRVQDGATSGGSVLATVASLASYSGNLTAGNIFSDNYFYANGTPFGVGGASGNVSSLINSGYTVSLGSNGVLTFPDGSQWGSSGGTTLSAAPDSALSISTTLGYNAPLAWSFGTDGSLTSPNGQAALYYSAINNLFHIDTSSPFILKTAANVGFNFTQSGNLSIIGTAIAANIKSNGNVTGTYFIGNGSQLTGLSVSYSNANVASYLPTYTGNIAGNIVKNGKTWTFGTDGTLTLPASSGQIGRSGYTNGIDLYNDNGGTGYVRMNYADQSFVWADSGGAHIQTTGGTWDFGTDGTTKFPNDRLQAPAGSLLTVQSTTTNHDENQLRLDLTAIDLFAYNTNADSWSEVLLNNSNVASPAAQIIVKANAGPELKWTFDSAGNLSLPGNLTTSSNVTGNYFLGNGSRLTGLGATYSNATVASYLPIYSGNVNAAYYFGNGSQLTGMYSNTSVNAYLSTSTIQSLTTSGNVTIGGNLIVNGNATTISTNNLIINDNIIYMANANPANSLDIGFAGHFTSGIYQHTGLVRQASSNSWKLFSNVVAEPGNTIDFANAVYDPIQTGSVTAPYFIGNGSSLTSITGANVSGTVAAATTATYVTGLSSANVTTALGYTPTTYANTNVAAYLSSNNAITIATTGNITSNNHLANAYLYANGVNILTGITGSYANANVSSYLASNSAVTILTTGNITGNYFIGNGALLTGIAASSTYSNTNVAAYLTTYSGNLTAGNILSNNHLYANGVSVLSDLYNKVYANANVASYLGSYGSNTIVTTGNITAGNLIGNVASTGNITASYFITSGSSGNISGVNTIFANNYVYANGVSILSNLAGNYANANVSTYLASNSAVTILTTGNVTGNYFIGNGSLLTGISSGSTYSNTNVAAYLPTYTGNLTAGNILSNSHLFANGVSITSDLYNKVYANANVSTYLSSNNAITIATTGNITSNNHLANAYLYANGVSITSDLYNKVYANANVSTYLASNSAITITTTGNITTNSYFVGNGSALTGITANVLGNIYGTSSNVTLVAGSYSSTFNNTGMVTMPNVTVTGNTSVTGNITTSGSFLGDGFNLSNVAIKYTSSWSVPTGNSTQSFTVTASNTYYMWVDCNIPNGILTWNATATVTNNNVPIVGAQYAWVYTGGGTPIDFTSIPNQFTGTANTIVRSSAAPSATTNRFDFGINNTSGNVQTVRYGWVRIS